MSSGSASERHVLLPHPACRPADIPGTVREFQVTVHRAGPRRLELQFALRAELASLDLPRPRPPARADGLWNHTCFEVFVLRNGSNEYREYNFAPSGAWAAYQFANYRAGMAALAETPTGAQWRSGEDSLELHVILEVPEGGLRVGCSAVLETSAGALSYWALRHPSEKPDFHDAAAFIVELGPNRID
jgi:hypothetical protein